MNLCLHASGKTVALAVEAFTLLWTHSVEKIEWREMWRVTEEGLVIERASVEGSGAGMEIPAGAVLKNGAWVYSPDLPPLAIAHFADAGRGRDDWTICADEVCRKIGDIVPAAGTTLAFYPCEEPAPTAFD